LLRQTVAVFLFEVALKNQTLIHGKAVCLQRLTVTIRPILCGGSWAGR
jgi:hypothetical protein